MEIIDDDLLDKEYSFDSTTLKRPKSSSFIIIMICLLIYWAYPSIVLVCSIGLLFGIDLVFRKESYPKVDISFSNDFLKLRKHKLIIFLKYKFIILVEDGDYFWLKYNRFGLYLRFRGRKRDVSFSELKKSLESKNCEIFNREDFSKFGYFLFLVNSRIKSVFNI